MGILSILYKKAKNTPVLIAGNREEAIDRPSQAPKIQSGTPRAVCGIDRRAGGTWFGVNQHGLAATLTNCRKSKDTPLSPTSRGALCRELLTCKTAREAAELAKAELDTDKYEGAHYLVADSEYAAVILGADEPEIVPLEPGLHMLSGQGLNNYRDEQQETVRRMLTLQTLDSSVTFLAIASRTFSTPPDQSGRRSIVQSGGRIVTVSSSLLSLSDRIQNATMLYAPGPPHEIPYDDLSALLRQVLSTGKSRRKKQVEEEEEFLLDDE